MIAAGLAGAGVKNSGAALSLSPPLAKPAPEKCPSARKAVRYYERRLNEWRAKMGAGTARDMGAAARRSGACPRYLAAVLQRKAYAARKAYFRWREYHFHWEAWLPANWVALARCETGLNFEHSNSSYTSAFGISWREYNADAAYMGAPPWHVRHTPRDQYKAALGHLARFGDGWGCPGP